MIKKNERGFFIMILNRKELLDKIHACWIGKNIGGTIGGPFEKIQEMLDVKGFTTEKGDPLPNDDLDLQLIWLCAMEEIGPATLSAADLGEYWINFIPPHWNEYGIGKANMRAGMLPPLCGEMHNDFWKNSNGAWIRSEIWACMAPGFPEIARKYAFMDACVDHGMGEGTIAEQFTVTMESLAFLGGSIRSIIEESLKAIPADSRVAKSICRVMEGYDRGEDWKDVRNALVKMDEDIGWFQAPANVGYVVLGLLYGEGDFKKSMLAAVNCGDDTDCTAATVGAFLGILYGTEGIPADWAEYIGDEIITISLDRSWRRLATIKTCTDLTRRTFNQIPAVLIGNDYMVDYTEEGFLVEPIPYSRSPITHPAPMERGQIGFDAFENPVMKIQVEYDRKPVLKAGESIEVRLILINKMHDSRVVQVKMRELPKGITAKDANGITFMDYKHRFETYSFTVCAEEDAVLEPMSHILAEVKCEGRGTSALFKIPFFA